MKSNYAFAVNFRKGFLAMTIVNLTLVSIAVFAQKIVIEPDTMNLNVSNVFTIQNSGESELNYIIKSNTSFRTFYSKGLTKLNSKPVEPGPMGLNAIPNDAGWSTAGSIYDPFFFLYFLGLGNLNENNGWASQGDNWEMFSPRDYFLLMRGKSNGSGVASCAYSPRVIQGSENVSTFSMNINFIYSAGTTWQIIPQSIISDQIVTRLQVNPDKSLQVLVKDSIGQAIFTQIDLPLPNGYFDLSLEIERGSSLFSLFFNGQRVFTGKGFSDHVDQVALLSLCEKSGSSIFLSQFYLNGNSSLAMLYNPDIYADLNEISGRLAAGESVIKELSFTTSDLTPGTYRDSVKIVSNDPDKPLLLLPFSVTVERPFEPPVDYSIPPVPLELSYDTLEATIYDGGSASIYLTLHNKAVVEQSIYFPPALSEQYEPKYQVFFQGSENFQWDDISTTGTALELGDDDSKTVEMPIIGFITISSNGYLVYGSTQAESPVDKNLNHDAWYEFEDEVYNVIAPYWDNLAPDELSGIYYLAERDKLIVQYTDVPFYGTTIRNTFQAIFNIDGAIEFKYLHMNDVQSASIGISPPGDNWWSTSVGVAHHEPFVTDSLTIFFQPPPAFERIDDTNFKSQYPWIHYPEAESIPISALSSQKIEIKFYSDSDYLPENLKVGVTTGRIFLYPNNFILPVKVTVLENATPVISPVGVVTVQEDGMVDITFIASDLNDSIVNVYLDSLPDFITLVRSEDRSVTYRIAPNIGEAGEYALVVYARDPHGAIDTDTLRLLITPYGSVVDFSLMYFKSGTVKSTFDESITLDVTDPDFEKYTIRANVVSNEIGSVRFMLNGYIVNIDNTEPYTISQWVLPLLTAGNHTIKAQSFSKKNARGEVYETKQVRITIINSATITQFEAVDNYGRKLVNIYDGSVINISQSEFKDFNIFAIGSSTSIRSVKFELNDATVRIDNQAPYALSGKVNGKETSLRLKPGAYTVRATPYVKYFGWGPAGIPLLVHFTIIQTPSGHNLAVGQSEFLNEEVQTNSLEDIQRLVAYPNPVQDELHIYMLLTEGTYLLKLMNTNGQVLLVQEGDEGTFQDFTICTTQLGLSGGVYYLQLTGSNGIQNAIRIMKQ